MMYGGGGGYLDSLKDTFQRTSNVKLKSGYKTTKGSPFMSPQKLEENLMKKHRATLQSLDSSTSDYLEQTTSMVDHAVNKVFEVQQPKFIVIKDAASKKRAHHHNHKSPYLQKTALSPQHREGESNSSSQLNKKPYQLHSQWYTTQEGY